MVFDSSGFGGLFTIAENLQKDSILSQINFANFVYCVKTQAMKATKFEKKILIGFNITE